jgi:hypothetical protein
MFGRYQASHAALFNAPSKAAVSCSSHGRQPAGRCPRGTAALDINFTSAVKNLEFPDFSM